MAWLVRFGYDGAQFHGWARQPGVRTIEGTLLDGLRRRALLRHSAPVSLPVASRTDRGVSARGNAVLIDSPLPGAALLRALNGVAPDVFFLAAHAVPTGFVPRHALYRHYRYLEPAEGHDVGAWGRVLARFVGRVDTRTFGRGVPLARPAWRVVDRATAATDGPWMAIDVVAPAFAWGMVRKIVAAVRAVEAGELDDIALADAIAGRRRLTLPLAEPGPLILWEVGYAFEFEVRGPGPSARQRRPWNTAARAAVVRGAVLDRLLPAVDGAI